MGAWCFGCLSGQLGFACWISFGPLFGLIYRWVLVLALSPCCVLVYMFKEMMRWWVGGISCRPDICVSWSASGLGVGLAPLDQFGPPVGVLLAVPGRCFFCGSFVFLFCLVFAVSLCASVCVCFVVACWGVASWLSFVVSAVGLSLSHWCPG